MESISLWLVIVFCIVALIVGAVIGFFVGRRTADDQKQIRDLKGELDNSRSEHKAYRQQVNNHFQKTSELFGRMTDNYRTVFLHLAEGSQELCSSDAAKLKPVSDDFPALENKRQEEKKQESTRRSAPTPEDDSQPKAVEETPQAEQKPSSSTASTDEIENISGERPETSRSGQEAEENRAEEEKNKEPA